MKLMNVAGGIAYLTNLQVPNPGFWIWPALLAELLIGITLILGHCDTICRAVHVRLPDHRDCAGASVLAVSRCSAGRPIRALLQKPGFDGRGLGAVLRRAGPVFG